MRIFTFILLLAGAIALTAADGRNPVNVDNNMVLLGPFKRVFASNRVDLADALAGEFATPGELDVLSDEVQDANTAIALRLPIAQYQTDTNLFARVTDQATISNQLQTVSASVALRLTIADHNAFVAALPGLYQGKSSNLDQWALYGTNKFATTNQLVTVSNQVQALIASLGSAAYVNSSAFTPIVYSSGVSNMVITLSNLLGTAAYANTSTFATAAQGVKADTAVQPGSLAPVATTGAYADLAGKPTLGTMASEPTNSWARGVTNGNSGVVITATNGVYYISVTTTAPASKATAQFRLSLVSGQSIVATNATNTTVYYTPHNGNAISLYDGTSSWTNATSAEISITVPSTTNTLYDVFIYDTGSAITYDLVAWTDDSTRATALVLQDGVWVKTGATKRKYVGTFRTWTTLGQVIDSDQHRLVFNHYNQTRKALKVVDTTDSWTYGTTAWRSLNSSTNNRINVVIGTVGNTASLRHYGQACGSGTPTAYFGVGINSTTVNSAQITGRNYNAGTTTTVGEWSGMLPAGFDYLQLIENSDGGTVTILGDNGKTYNQTGGLGEIWN